MKNLIFSALLIFSFSAGAKVNSCGSADGAAHSNGGSFAANTAYDICVQRCVEDGNNRIGCKIGCRSACECPPTAYDICVQRCVEDGYNRIGCKIGCISACVCS